MIVGLHPFCLFLSLQDDKVSMDFVAAAANLRAYVFGLPNKSRFDIKGMTIIF